MFSTGIVFDRNFLIVIGITVCLAILCIFYLRLLSNLLRGKGWRVALGIFVIIFVVTLVSMIIELRRPAPTTMTPYIVLLVLKMGTILQGIFYLSVELGRSQGLRKTVISLKENEVLIVLSSVVFTNIALNLHTMSWNLERGIIVSIFNFLFAYLIVNIVFYLGEIKYYLMYAVPMMLVFLGMRVLSGSFTPEKTGAFLQTQVGIILTLVFSTVYLFIKMRYELVESRSITRKVNAIDVDELGLK